MKPPSPVLCPFGKNGPLVPRIGFSTMGMGFPCSRLTAPIPDPERLALLDHAYELGCTFWDTSDVYGDAEVIIGTWLALNPEKGKDIFLATKFGDIQLPTGFEFRGRARFGTLVFPKSPRQPFGVPNAVHPIACVQMEDSAFSTEIESPEHNILATCRELGTAVAACSPLSRGLLGEDVQGPDDFGGG
ncbi:hypothetical protein DL768_003891 [Monosporascus sp. mg162]|nr:hypothetical protein DL768_003891 [Monosporascus sp. mg162]